MTILCSDITESQPHSEVRKELRELPILVVDDTEALRDRLESDLTSLGFSPTAVSSVQEGITTLRNASKNTPYELVVVAREMPAINGLEMCDLIREGNGFPRSPKLILTSNEQNNDLASYVADGRIDAFLNKPFKAASLFETLQHIFAERLASNPIEDMDNPPESPMLEQRDAGIPKTRNHEQKQDIVMRLIHAGCDIKDLDLEAGLLYVDRNRDLYETILKVFLTNNTNVESQIRAALDVEDHATAERLAHSLKGIAATIGAKKLQRAAKNLENAIYDKRADVTQNELQSINVAMAALIEQLHCVLAADQK